MQNPTVKKEGVWMVGRCGPNCLGVKLLELRNAGA